MKKYLLMMLINLFLSGLNVYAQMHSTSKTYTIQEFVMGDSVLPYIISTHLYNKRVTN
jgi:hypothetical protein